MNYQTPGGIDVRVVNRPCLMRINPFDSDDDRICNRIKQLVFLGFNHRGRRKQVICLVCEHQRNIFPGKHWTVEELICLAEEAHVGGDWQEMHDRLKCRVSGLPAPYRKRETRPGKGMWKEWDGPMKKKLEDLSANSFSENVWIDSVSDQDCNEIAYRTFPRKSKFNGNSNENKQTNLNQINQS